VMSTGPVLSSIEPPKRLLIASPRQREQDPRRRAKTPPKRLRDCQAHPIRMDEVTSDSVAAMDAESLKAMYRRWLLEVWGAGRYDVVDELIHVDLVDHNRYEGQPDGRAGDVWAAQMVRLAFPDLRFVPDLVVSDGEFVVGRGR